MKLIEGRLIAEGQKKDWICKKCDRWIAVAFNTCPFCQETKRV